MLFCNHIDCTCAVSLLCEWGCASSNLNSQQMTCYTVDNCTCWPHWPHCGFACVWKGFRFLQMSSNTHHKKIVETSLMRKKCSLVWRSFLTVRNFRDWPLSLLQKHDMLYVTFENIWNFHFHKHWTVYVRQTNIAFYSRDSSFPPKNHLRPIFCSLQIWDWRW